MAARAVAVAAVAADGEAEAAAAAAAPHGMQIEKMSGPVPVTSPPGILLSMVRLDRTPGRIIVRAVPTLGADPGGPAPAGPEGGGVRGPAAFVL